MELCPRSNYCQLFWHYLSICALASKVSSFHVSQPKYNHISLHTNLEEELKIIWLSVAIQVEGTGSFQIVKPVLLEYESLSIA
jgi:hypothetical protein